MVIPFLGLCVLVLQVTPGEKDCPAAQGTAQRVFFAVVRTIARYDGEHARAADTFGGATVHMAVTRAQVAGGKMQEGILHAMGEFTSAKEL